MDRASHPPTHGETLVSRTARALSDLSLSVAPGDYLGAEGELLERLAVSRPTLRQAAKIVESDRLIRIRRGTGGGYFADRPDARDAIRSLIHFLRLRGATLADVIQVTRPIGEEAAAAAARLRTAADAKQVAAFVATIDDRDSARELIAGEVEMARMISALSGNPVIELVMEIGYSFGLGERGFDLYSDADRRARARALQRSLLTAIADGDPEVARLMMRRRSALFDSWLEPDRREDTA